MIPVSTTKTNYTEHNYVKNRPFVFEPNVCDIQTQK